MKIGLPHVNVLSCFEYSLICYLIRCLKIIEGKGQKYSVCVCETLESERLLLHVGKMRIIVKSGHLSCINCASACVLTFT